MADELPNCQLCGTRPVNEEHATETQRRWKALTHSPTEAASPAALSDEWCNCDDPAGWHNHDTEPPKAASPAALDMNTVEDILADAESDGIIGPEYTPRRLAQYIIDSLAPDEAASPAALDVERLGFHDLLDVAEAILSKYPPDTIVCSHLHRADIGARTVAAIADLIESARLTTEPRTETNLRYALKTTHFPDVKLHGGPLGRALELEVDGEVPPKVTRVEIVGDVGDVVRMTTTQLVSLADVQLHKVGWEQKYIASVRVWTKPQAPEGEIQFDEPLKIEGIGDDALSALKDAVRQLEEET